MRCLKRAVARTLVAGPSAVFLSGGVDSIAVAATATDLLREHGDPDPLALSLTFPDPASNEELIQKGVARQLGIDQSLVPFDEAIGDAGLLGAGLRLTAGWPQPMLNFWAPAYVHLAGIAADRGKRVVLTGRGGDEWLTVTPYVLADLIRRGDVGAAHRFVRMRQRSNGLGGWRDVLSLVWRTAGRPLASAALATVAPGPWHARRLRRLLSERPAWLAPDPAIRAEMDARAERAMLDPRPAQGFYMREVREALFHPALTHDMEETQELGRRSGLRVLHPFWDVDLISMLYRVPPSLLIRDGRTKWLLRRRVAKRLPGLGLEQRGKVYAGHVFRDILEREAPGVSDRLGGQLAALASVGVVGGDGIALMSHQRTLSQQWQRAGRFWTLLNLECWVRERQ